MKQAQFLAPRLLLQLEGAAVLILSFILYWLHSGNWWLYVLLFLAPDLVALIYLAGPRIGALSYNLVHSYILPIALFIYGTISQNELAISLALIWISHIGVDRVLGMGLKYNSAFQNTHFGRL